MKALITFLLAGFLAASVYGEENLRVGTTQEGANYILDRLVITLRPGTDPLSFSQSAAGQVITGDARIDLLCAANGVIAVEPYYPYPVKHDVLRALVERMYVFKLAPDRDALNVKDNFLVNKDIESSDLWSLPRSSYIPNDPSVGQQWALSMCRLFGAWDIIRGDTTESVVIAIDDTGIYHTHPDLQGNMWINGPEDINGNGIFDSGDINYDDDDGNGYPDDVVGYDLGRNDSDPSEDAPTHGTHVAGCASEIADNNIGGAGPGFAARLMAVKITNAQGYLVAGYIGLIYAGDNGADIINCSWGSPSYSSGEQNIVNAVYSLGVLIVAAAGNDDYWTPPYNNYPSAYNHVLGVAATDQYDNLAGFSNYGSWVDVSAPGVFIYSTWATSSYSSLSGTSMSSPIVAGVAALVKAQNPGYNPDQLTTILMTSADNIDSLNPGYEGLIGAGRVNAHAALGASNYPNIYLVSQEVFLVTDDGDGIINPGESIDIAVTLENAWQDAFNVVLTLRGVDGVTITDSVTSIGTFPGQGGQVDNYSDPFGLTYDADVVPGEYVLTLHVSANGPYSTDIDIPVAVSLNQVNFPKTLPDAIESDPLICDFDVDGGLEILVGCNDSKLYSIESNGTYTPGWPVLAAEDITTAPAVGDINNNGQHEIVATTRDGQIYCWNRDGDVMPNFPVATGGSVFANPTLADLDGNNDLEIIQPNYQTHNIDVLNHDGSAFGNWPFVSTMGWYGSAAVGNIDGDQLPEILIGGFDNQLHAFNGDKTEVAGFPVTLDNRIWISPAIGNVDPSDPEPEIVIATQAGSVYLVNHDGTFVTGWPVNVGNAVKSPPAMGDLNNDGYPEVIFGASDSSLHAYQANGQPRAGFPVALGSAIAVSPVVADLSGDGTPEIVVANGTSQTYIYVIRADGQPLQNTPIPTSASGNVMAAAAIWDLDADGDLEIVFGIQTALEVIDYKSHASVHNVEWAVCGNDKFRSSNFDAYSPLGIDDQVDAEVPTQFALNQNYPNPFNSRTVISFTLEAESTYSLEVYDLLGRRVRDLGHGLKPAGTYAVTWDGCSDSGTPVASGIYFYKLEAGNKVEARSMVYLK